jgi:hypothetical protein
VQSARRGYQGKAIDFDLHQSVVKSMGAGLGVLAVSMHAGHSYQGASVVRPDQALLEMELGL